MEATAVVQKCWTIFYYTKRFKKECLSSMIIVMHKNVLDFLKQGQPYS